MVAGESGISNVGWGLIVAASIVAATVISVSATLLYVKKRHGNLHGLTRKRVCKQLRSGFYVCISSLNHETKDCVFMSFQPDQYLGKSKG